MIGRIKLAMKHRHERKLVKEFGDILHLHEVEFDMHELRVTCPNPFHFHTLPVVEAKTPRPMNVFVNMQTQASGRVVVLSIHVGESLENIDDDHNPGIYSLRRGELTRHLEELATKIQVDWIAAREGLL